MLAVICGQRVTGKAKTPNVGATNPGLKGRHDCFVTSVWPRVSHITSPHPVLLGLRYKEPNTMPKTLGPSSLHLNSIGQNLKASLWKSFLKTSAAANSKMWGLGRSGAQMSKENTEAKSALTWKSFKILPTAKKCRRKEMKKCELGAGLFPCSSHCSEIVPDSYLLQFGACRFWFSCHLFNYFHGAKRIIFFKD